MENIIPVSQYIANIMIDEIEPFINFANQESLRIKISIKSPAAGLEKRESEMFIDVTDLKTLKNLANCIGEEVDIDGAIIPANFKGKTGKCFLIESVSFIPQDILMMEIF